MTSIHPVLTVAERVRARLVARSSGSLVLPKLRTAMQDLRAMYYVAGIAVWPVAAEARGRAIAAAELTSLEVEQHGAVDPLRRGVAGAIVGS